MKSLGLAVLALACSAAAQDVTADIYDSPASATFLLRAHPASNSVGFDLFTDHEMVDGWLLYLCNLYQPVFGVDFAGNGFFAGGLTVGNTIVLNGGGSGAVALAASDGLYLPIAGALPFGYWGYHGAVTLVNKHPMIAGFIGEFGNPTSGIGAFSDKKLMVNYQGGLVQFGGYCEATFAPCGEYDNRLSIDDGGEAYYVATDAGVAQDGTLMLDKCTHRWKQCVVDGVNATYPAGAWVQVKLVGDP